MLFAVLNSLALLFGSGEELMALILLTVYVGAIAILFLFVALFVNPETPRLRLVLLLPTVGITLVFLFMALNYPLTLFFIPVYHSDSSYVDFVDFLGYAPIFYQFGILLFKYYFFSTFVVSLILLAAMVGTILLAFPPRLRVSHLRSIV